MPTLPPSALGVLGEVGRDLAEVAHRRPIAAARTKVLSPVAARRALAQAARASREGQVAACLYSPGHGEPLVVLRAADVERLADLLKRAEIDDEGSRES